MKRAKEDDYERILKAQEDLNNILLSKLHSNEKEKHKEPELNMEITTPYKCKGRKLEFPKHEVESSSEESTKHNTKMHQVSSEISDSNKMKRK